MKTTRVVLALLAVFSLLPLNPLHSQTPAPADPAASPANAAALQEGAVPATAPPVQPGNATYTIQRTTRLVVLDMVVTDAQGNLISDLKQNEVHVQEAGEPQTIENFDPAGAHMPDPSVSIDSTADLDRLAPRSPVNIILLDEFNTRFEDMAFARYSLKKYLDKAPGKLDTPTMLIAVSLDKFTVLRDYTQSKDELLAALDHHFAILPWQAQQGAWVGERYATAFITLRRVAEAVIGHRGHKNMIWIGRGFPSLNFASQPIDTANRVNTAVQDCVNRLRDARITLYTIDPAGLMSDPNEYGGGIFSSSDPFGGNYEFDKLARATGGRTLHGRNDVNAEIGTAIQDAASFYTVTYRPTSASNDPQKFRRIVVTIDRPGARVITRQGYYPRASAPAKPFDPQKPSKRLVTDLLAADSSTMVYDGIPLSLKPSPTDPDTFVLHIDSKGLVWSPATDTEPRHSEIIVLVSTYDKKGKELKRVAKTLIANAPATVPPTGRLDRAMDINYKVDHDPKAVRARFVVRVIATSRMGTADADLVAQSAIAAPVVH